MSQLKDYFQAPNGDVELHPQVRKWRRQLSDGSADNAKCELWRKRQGLTFAPATIHVELTKDGVEVSSGTIEWDPDTNMELMRLGVQAVTPVNEAKRLALMLQHWFSIPEARYGDGYFNSVLYDFLKQSPLGAFKPIADALSSMHEYNPSKGASYVDCVGSIEAVIRTAARALVESLRYGEDEAEGILVNAIAEYLDERFSITNRHMLGLG